jgi:SLT domain-containing protein
MFQFLDSTWATVGAKKTADPYAQAQAGLRYIASVYGSPAAAYGAWLGRSPHWYGEGGIFRRPTIIGVGERGPEAVVPLERAGLDYDRFGKAIADAFRERPPGGVIDYARLAAAIAANPPRIHLDRQLVSHELRTGALWEARR